MTRSVHINMALCFKLILCFYLQAASFAQHTTMNHNHHPSSIIDDKIVIQVSTKGQSSPSASLASNDVTQMQIGLNATRKAACFEHKGPDGAYNKWCLLFEKGLQLWKSIALGETDLGDPPFYFMCFVSVLTPEEIGWQNIIFQSYKFDSTSVQSAEIDLQKSVNVLNRKIEAKSLEEYWEDLNGYCSGTELIHLTQDAVKQLAKGKEEAMMQSMLKAVDPLPTSNNSAYPLCEEAAPMWELGCICRRTICIPWFPCGLKFCTSDENKDGETAKHYCGISTCQRCNLFEFYVPRKKICFWNIKY